LKRKKDLAQRGKWEPENIHRREMEKKEGLFNIRGKTNHFLPIWADQERRKINRGR